MKQLPITPIGCRIVVEEYKITKTRAGLVLPEKRGPGAALESPTGLVVSVGPTVKQVKLGDRVVLSDKVGVGAPFYFEGDLYILLDEEQIVAIFQKVATTEGKSGIIEKS